MIKRRTKKPRKLIISGRCFAEICRDAMVHCWYVEIYDSDIYTSEAAEKMASWLIKFAEWKDFLSSEAKRK